MLGRWTVSFNPRRVRLFTLSPSLSLSLSLSLFLSLPPSLFPSISLLSLNSLIRPIKAVYRTEGNPCLLLKTVEYVISIYVAVVTIANQGCSLFLNSTHGHSFCESVKRPHQSCWEGSERYFRSVHHKRFFIAENSLPDCPPKRQTSVPEMFRKIFD